MAAGLTVRTDLVMRGLNLLIEDLPPEQLAKWGWPLAEQNKPLMLTKQARVLLGAAALDRQQPEFGEHWAYLKGAELADPHWALYPNMRSKQQMAERYKILIRVLGNAHLERVLRNNGD